ncbi:tetratricopeptide repeat protein [Candidatus Omnitrophota bacterium]
MMSLAALSATSSIHAKQTPEELFAQAIKYQTESNLKKAEKTFTRVIKSSFSHYPSLYNLSLISVQKQDYKNALKYLKQAKELNPFDLRIDKMLSTAYLILNNNEDAKKHLLQITQKKPDDITSHMKMGLIHIREKNFNGAIGEYTLSKNLTPSNINVNLLLALAYSLNDDFKSALNKITPIQKQLEDGPHLIFYAFLLAHNNRLDEAHALYPKLNLSEQDQYNQMLIKNIEEKIIKEENATYLPIEEFTNPEITQKIIAKLEREKELGGIVETTDAKKKSLPYNLKATLNETFEFYDRTTKAASPINSLNVTNNLKVEGKTDDGITFSGEFEGYYNRWDNTKLDFYKINTKKSNDFEVDLGKFSAKHFPTLVSYPTVLDGVRAWKKYTLPEFEPTPIEPIDESTDAIVNLGEMYRENYIDNRTFQNVEITAVTGRTQEKKNIGDRKNKNEGSTESSGQFEQWTQSYRISSKVNSFMELGTSCSLTQDKSRKTIVGSSTTPIESIALGIDGGIDLFDNDLNIDWELATGNYDEDTLDMVTKHKRDLAWYLKAKHKIYDTATFTYEQKAIGRNFKVEGASQTQDKITHSMDLVYKPQKPRTWLIQSQTFKYKPEQTNPDGGGSSKKQINTFQSISEFKLPQDAKYTFDYKSYREKDKCDCSNYSTITIKNSLDLKIPKWKTTFKPSYTFERKNDIIPSATDEVKKEYVFTIENKSIKNLELDLSIELETKKYDGATTKSYHQYIHSFEAKYTFIPSRLDSKLKLSNDFKDPSDTNETDISTILWELNYTSKDGDDKFAVKYERKLNIYLPWSDSSAYRQNYAKIKYTRKF